MIDGGTVMEICAHHLHTAPQRPSARLGRPVPRDLEELVLRCLAKTPGERPASVGELAEALAACADASSWSSAVACSWWRETMPRLRDRRDFEKDRDAALELAQTKAPLRASA